MQFFCCDSRLNKKMIEIPKAGFAVWIFQAQCKLHQPGILLPNYQMGSLELASGLQCTGWFTTCSEGMQFRLKLWLGSRVSYVTKETKYGLLDFLAAVPACPKLALMSSLPSRLISQDSLSHLNLYDNPSTPSAVSFTLGPE